MDKNKFQLSVFILAFVVVLLSTIFVTYAYFTARGSSIKTKPLNVSSASIGQAYSQSGTLMELHITGDYTLKGRADAEKPAIVVENSAPIEVYVETAEKDGTLTCYYDITYIPHVPYLNSEENINDDKELVIWGIEKNFGLANFDEVKINNVTEEIILGENIKIEASGINEKVAHTWQINVGFYNQLFDQTDKSRQLFSGDIEVKNLKCDNFVNK